MSEVRLLVRKLDLQWSGTIHASCDVLLSGSDGGLSRRWEFWEEGSNEWGGACSVLPEVF